MSISLRKFWLFLIPALAWGQGSQLPKYTVATLPSASSFPSYVVQVIDGANAADCSIGGGSISVFCKSQSGSWVPQSSSVINPASQFSVFGQQNVGTQAIASAIPNIVADAGGNFLPNSSQPKVSPMADIRANGAKIDGSTDIGPAIAASQAQCNAANGNACTVLLPCTGPNGCFWANGTDGVTLANNVTVMLQGVLNLQTTLVTGNVSTNIIGSDDGHGGSQFAGPNQIAGIIVPSTDNGVLGTAVTVTPTSGNFGVTQAFTPSTMAGLYPNTWITIAGPVTCTISTISRTSNLVTATLSGSCHIPPGVPLTIAGVTDSSFNGTYSGSGVLFTTITSDYVQNTMTWTQTTAANASSTGGTVTGLNEDTIENVQIASCTVSTCTATFYRNHAATDVWGVDGVAMDAGSNGSHAQLLKNINISAPGTALDAGGFNSQINYVSATQTGQCTNKYYSFPVSVIGSSFIRFDSDAFDAFCSPFSMHVWNQWNYGFAAAGPIYINNSFLLRGVKLDHGGSDTYISKSTCDQCFAAIAFDPNFYWNGNRNFLSLDKIVFNDNTNGFTPVGLYQLFPLGTNSPAGVADGRVKQLYGAIQAVTNDYFSQVNGDSLKNDTPLSNSFPTPRGIKGTYNDGKVIDGEVRGSNANFSPEVIPFATKTVTVNPSGWTGNCTVTTGVLGPDGTTNAGSLVQNSSDLENFGAASSLTPAVGDVVLFGAWVYSPTSGVLSTAQGTGKSVLIDNNSSTHFSFNYVAPGAYQSVGGNESAIVNDWWHPVVGLATVTSSDGTSGQVINLRGSCDTVKTISYFDPWMMYIPASAGISIAELQRWRTQLMHGYVPPSATAGTLAADPNLPITSGANQLLPANPLPLGQFKNFAGSGSPSDTCDGTTGFLGAIENNASNSVYKCIYNGTSYLWQQLSTGSASIPSVPAWLLWQGDGSGGAFSCATGTCSMRGENWFSSVNIASGATAFLSAPGSGTLFEGPLTIRSTGTCTIAGTLSASPNSSATGVNGNSFGGGSGGGGGGGTAAGVAGNNSGNASTVGTAGAASGGTGGNASNGDARDYNLLVAGSISPTTNFNLPYGGAKGGNGGSSGGTGGLGGGSIVLDCATINFTGTIDVSGANGTASAANNTGSGGGGGGGFVIMRSQNMTNSGTITLSGGSGGSCGAFTGCGAGGTGHAGWSEVFTQ